VGYLFFTSFLEEVFTARIIFIITIIIGIAINLHFGQVIEARAATRALHVQV
jgi:hypothetical protein